MITFKIQLLKNFHRLLYCLLALDLYGNIKDAKEILLLAVQYLKSFLI